MHLFIDRVPPVLAARSIQAVDNESVMRFDKWNGWGTGKMGKLAVAIAVKSRSLESSAASRRRYRAQAVACALQGLRRTMSFRNRSPVRVHHSCQELGPGRNSGRENGAPILCRGATQSLECGAWVPPLLAEACLRAKVGKLQLRLG